MVSFLHINNQLQLTSKWKSENLLDNDRSDETQTWLTVLCDSLGFNTTIQTPLTSIHFRTCNNCAISHSLLISWKMYARSNLQMKISCNIVGLWNVVVLPFLSRQGRFHSMQNIVMLQFCGWQTVVVFHRQTAVFCAVDQYRYDTFWCVTLLKCKHIVTGF